MGDRYYVRSVLADVFDLTETEASTIGAKFSTPFGGACDYYMRGESEGATPAFQVQDRGCSYYPKQTVLPVSAPDRSAILAVACDDLLNDYKYFQRAIRKIHPAWPALDGQFSAKPSMYPLRRRFLNSTSFSIRSMSPPLQSSTHSSPSEKNPLTFGHPGDTS